MTTPVGKVCILEGNISAGKSTLAKSLGEVLNYKVFFEPTVHNPFLEKFYSDPKRYALPMQLWLVRQRFRTYVSAVRHAIESGQGVILDRSVYSDCVFAIKNRIDGNISEEGYEYYAQLREQMLRHLPIPQVTLYLDTDPVTCFDRIHSVRKRDCESGIPLDYLTGLHNIYHDFLQEMERAGSHVIIWDWNSFGNPARIARQLEKVPTETLSEWRGDEAVKDFVYTEAEVRKAMRPHNPAPDDSFDSDLSDALDDDLFDDTLNEGERDAVMVLVDQTG